MNEQVPLTELKRGGRHLVWLDPARYTADERMFIAARVTRSFLTPDEMLARFYIAGDSGVMRSWLRENIAADRHDSVLEFPGQEYTVWISGVSLGTIRDVDRHRRFSYEEFTTRHLGLALKKYQPILQQVFNGDYQDYLTHKETLDELFYVHPSMQTDCGAGEVQEFLWMCARSLLRYIHNTTGSSKPSAADIYRGVLPLALRTPFLMAGNQRDWFEASGKRTCYRVGHREYVDLFRDLTELLHPVAPFLTEGACRWCPAQAEDGCCRKAWQEQLTQVVTP